MKQGRTHNMLANMSNKVIVAVCFVSLLLIVSVWIWYGYKMELLEKELLNIK